MDFREHFDTYKQIVDKKLGTYFAPDGFAFDGLLEAMNYSLTASGKRIRAMLVMEFCRACGGSAISALPVACAIEMLHTYSLIHDDLPCMDNDELRRGSPTCHIAFGETTAVLAGDALLTEAFGTILRSELPAEIRAGCAEVLAGSAGIDGMCGGQFIDTVNDGITITEEQLMEIHGRKTSALIIAACRMGVVVGGATEKKTDAASIFGASVGLAFQIRDDMLDVLSSNEVLGKPVGSDKKGQKTTYMDIYGEAECERMIAKLTEAAKTAIRNAFEETEMLCELADFLSSRSY